MRGVNLPAIESAMRRYENRLEAWKRIAPDRPFDKLDPMIHAATLGGLPALGRSILGGGVKGRVVVDVNA